jgi:pantothenate kinase-related protein Tda10
VGRGLKFNEKKIPRLRMFAGPNGSGKSTFKSIIQPELLGVYINPDEIEKKFVIRVSWILMTIK